MGTASLDVMHCCGGKSVYIVIFGSKTERFAEIDTSPEHEQVVCSMTYIFAFPADL
jgi:hypothetical protein